LQGFPESQVTQHRYPYGASNPANVTDPLSGSSWQYRTSPLAHDSRSRWLSKTRIALAVAGLILGGGGQIGDDSSLEKRKRKSTQRVLYAAGRMKKKGSEKPKPRPADFDLDPNNRETAIVGPETPPQVKGQSTFAELTGHRAAVPENVGTRARYRTRWA
jgi:hypothetical protein